MTLPNVPQAEGMSPEVRRYLEAVKRDLEAAVDSIATIDMPTKASEAEAETGTNDEKFLTPLSGVAAVKAHSPFVKFAHYQDQQAQNTDGGTFSSGAWQTRTLNTEVYDNIGLTLSSNELSLAAGDYLIDVIAPAFKVESHQARLYNVTDASAILTGTSEHAGNNTGTIPNTTSRSAIRGRFTLASTKSVRVEHRCTQSRTTDGFGYAANLGTEIYTDLIIWKLD